MKKTFCAVVLVLLWAVASQAATVYLKTGGQVKAKRVWREKGKVVVLINHESITTFANSEINLKKTFPPRKKRVKPVKVVETIPVSTSGTADSQAGQPTKEGKKSSLPSLSGKLPEREIPQGSEEGTLRKQKREMEEQLKAE